MMSRASIITGLVATMLAGQPAVAQRAAPLELTPAGNWSVDYGDDACTLNRQFVWSEGSVSLQIEQRRPGHWFGLVLASNQLAGGRGPIIVAVEPGTVMRAWENPERGQSGSTSAVRFGDVLLPYGVENAFRADPATLASYREAEASITSVLFDNALERPVSLQLGSMTNALDALRTCVDDLLLSWGMDPAGAALMVVPAERIGQADWARRVNRAYPRDMMREGRSAIVRVVIAIAADGTVAHCHAHNPQPYPQFEETTCRVLQEHARYRPARDAEGNAVPSFDSMDVAFSP